MSYIPYFIPQHILKNCCTLSRKLEQIIISVNHQWWDNFFLEQYISHSISPRGLRVLKTCFFLSRELQTEWSHISEFCTQKWMQTIIKQCEQKSLDLIQQPNISILSKLSPHLPKTWFNTLKQHMKKDEDKLIKVKLGKMRRDLDDFNLGRVFNWKKGFQPPFVESSLHPCPPPMSLMDWKPWHMDHRLGPFSGPAIPVHYPSAFPNKHRFSNNPHNVGHRALTPNPNKIIQTNWRTTIDKNLH